MFHAIMGRTMDNVVLGIGPYTSQQKRQMYQDLRRFQGAFGHMEWLTLELHPRDEERIARALDMDNPPAFMLPNGEPLERRTYGRHT